MFCTKCGKEIGQGAGFCVYCGAKVSSGQSASPVNGSQTSAPTAPRMTAPHPVPLNDTGNTEKNKPKKKKTGILIIFLIIIVLMVGFACLVLIDNDFLSFSYGGIATSKTGDKSEDDADGEGDTDKAYAGDDVFVDTEDDTEETADSMTDHAETAETAETAEQIQPDVKKPAQPGTVVSGDTSKTENANAVSAKEKTEADIADDGESAEYMLPGSDSRYLSKSDLEGFTAEQCRIARNEIYARHGRKFKDEELQKYFNSKPWYDGTIDPDSFSDSKLNDFEIANRDLIVKYEKEHGFR